MQLTFNLNIKAVILNMNAVILNMNAVILNMNAVILRRSRRICKLSLIILLINIFLTSQLYAIECIDHYALLAKQQNNPIIMAPIHFHWGYNAFVQRVVDGNALKLTDGAKASFLESFKALRQLVDKLFKSLRHNHTVVSFQAEISKQVLEDYPVALTTDAPASTLLDVWMSKLKTEARMTELEAFRAVIALMYKANPQLINILLAEFYVQNPKKFEATIESIMNGNAQMLAELDAIKKELEEISMQSDGTNAKWKAALISMVALSFIFLLLQAIKGLVESK